MLPFRKREEHGDETAKTPSGLPGERALRESLPGYRLPEFPVEVLHGGSPVVLNIPPNNVLRKMDPYPLSILSPKKIGDCHKAHRTKDFGTPPSFHQGGTSQLLTDHPCLAPAKLQDRLGASPSVPRPTILHRTPLPSPENPDANVHSMVNDVERERDELRAEVARLETEKRNFIQDVCHPLGWSNANDWQPDIHPYNQILELAHTLRANFEHASHSAAYIEEECRQLGTTQEKTVKELTTRLDEQKETSRHAIENCERLEDENKRLQQLVDTRAKEYQEMRQSQEEKHSATLERLIKEHTAEMSEQMNVYERELADLRVAHEQEGVENPEYEEELDRLLKSIKLLGRKHLRKSEGSRSQNNDG